MDLGDGKLNCHLLMVLRRRKTSDIQTQLKLSYKQMWGINVLKVLNIKRTRLNTSVSIFYMSTFSCCSLLRNRTTPIHTRSN